MEPEGRAWGLREGHGAWGAVEEGQDVCMPYVGTVHTWGESSHHKTPLLAP